MSTFIGKILVIVITAMSLLFLGISTVVFATSKDWRTATAADQKKVDELKKKIQTVRQDVDAAKKGLEDAKADLAGATKSLGNRLSALNEENKRDLEKITATREQLVTAQQTARDTLEQVEAKRQQIERLHQEQAAVAKQADAYKAYEAELNDRIHEIERILEPASKHHSELHKPAGRFSAMR